MRANDSMITPPVEELLDRTDSKFALVTLGARRARQINSYFNQLGDGLGNSIPPQVSSIARKPLSIAFEEIAADKIVKTELPEDVYYNPVDGNSYLNEWATPAADDVAVDDAQGAADDAGSGDAPAE